MGIFKRELCFSMSAFSPTQKGLTSSACKTGNGTHNVLLKHIFTESSSQTFYEACVDSDAQQSVIGHPQDFPYSPATSFEILPMKNVQSFRFGDGAFRSIERLFSQILTPDQS